MSRSTMHPPDRRIGHGTILAVLLGITVAVYLQVFRHPFVDLDDVQYVIGNPHVRAGITRDGFRWAFSATEASNWHPLTWISHQADVELFGLSPGAHHLVNLLLHLVNTALLYAAFAATTGCRWRSGFVAAAFALHPLHVESVAWISERKDLLSALFGLLALNAHARYARNPSLRSYLPVPVLLSMSLLSKPMLVTLPFVLLLLDYWPLGRIAGEAGPPTDRNLPAIPAFPLRFLLIEKVPLLVLSATSCVVTFIVQDRSGAVAPADLFPIQVRAANAVAAYINYIGKTAWPHPLVIFYPHSGGEIAAWKVVPGIAFLILVTGTVLHFRRSRPALSVGWFWYLGTLVPVIGLVQVGLQGMADRYTYLPQTGLTIMVAYGVFRGNLRGSRHFVFLAPVASLLLLALSVASWNQVGIWRSSGTLFSHAVRHTAGNFLAYNALGKSTFVEGRPEEAIRYIQEALRIRPAYPLARYNLGVIYDTLGRTGDAVAEYREALRLKPNYPDAWTNLGALLHRRGQIDEAARHYREALRWNPDDPVAHDNLGLIFLQQGKRAEAIYHFREALRANPGYARAAGNLRNAIGN